MSISFQCRSCRRKFRVDEKYAGQRTKCPNCGQEMVISQQSARAHDIFISYSSSDEATAGALCSALEGKGFKCWIAPRDVRPGADWGEAIIGAIEQCRLMILVLSAESNKSVQVKREVERSASKGVTIIPFRIEDVPLSKSMEFFISSQHWFDALTPPLKKHIDRLVREVGLILSEEEASSVPRPDRNLPATGAISQTAQKNSGSSEISRTMLLIAAGAGILAALVSSALALALWLGSNSGPSPTPVNPLESTNTKPGSEQTTPQPVETIEKKIVGTWKLNDQSLGSLNTVLEDLLRKGIVKSSDLESLQNQYKSFRFTVTPLSDPNQFRIEIELQGTFIARDTLSLSSDEKRLDGSNVTNVILEFQPDGTLKGQKIPGVTFLEREWVYQKAD